MCSAIRATKNAAMLLVIALTSCSGSGPDVILVPALAGSRTPVQLAQPVRSRVFVDLPDGTLSISENKVSFPAGVWLFMYDPKDDPKEPD